jgi:hypothetical protein
VLLFLRGSAWLRPETPDLTIRLALQEWRPTGWCR